MSLAFIFLFSQLSWAAGPAPVGPNRPMGLEDYIQDLSDDNRSDRLFAARELRRRVRRTTQLANGRPGSLRSEEARNDLLIYDQRLAPAMYQVLLQQPELRAPCVDILRYLETTDAKPVLTQARQEDPDAGYSEKIDRALLQVTNPVTPVGDS